jgi:alkylated DNA repair dioxygenase AlkB
MAWLFDLGIPWISGFKYEPDFISSHEEATLLHDIRALEFGAVMFRGVQARRRVVSFGYDYEFGSRKTTPGSPIPPFLLPLRQQAAEFAERDPDELAEVLVTEYQPGAGIGWHRDAPPFGLIVGVSLLSKCTLKLRPREGVAAAPVALELEPRSVYVFDGVVRSDWEHSIPATKHARYSVTFRTLRGGV